MSTGSRPEAVRGAASRSRGGPAAVTASQCEWSLSLIYSETTRSIEVTVQPSYLEEQSSPENRHFVWAYHVQIKNHGAERVQLLNRYWRITDARGTVQEVDRKSTRLNSSQVKTSYAVLCLKKNSWRATVPR